LQLHLELTYENVEKLTNANVSVFTAWKIEQPYLSVSKGIKNYLALFLSWNSKLIIVAQVKINQTVIFQCIPHFPNVTWFWPVY